jgi:hypothetical protein
VPVVDGHGTLVGVCTPHDLSTAGLAAPDAATPRSGRLDRRVRVASAEAASDDGDQPAGPAS